MGWVDLAFWVFGTAAVWFGWRVFRTDSMVRATFALLASFLNAGAIMLLLLGEYLGTALFFMMAVEMTVMGLFMVAFMMNPAGLNPMQMVHQQRLSVAAGAVTFGALSGLAFAVDWPDRPLRDPAGTIRALGHEVMGDSMLVMETVGVTLLATIVGAVILSSHRGRFGAGDEGSLPPALDPATGERPGPVAVRQGHDHHGGHGGDHHGSHEDHGAGG